LIDVNEDDSILLAAVDSSIVMFSIQTKERLGSIENHMNQVSFLQFSIGSSEYFLSSEMEDTKLLLWSAKKYD
jgi:L-rhamnose isomerase